jgi:competence protein ComEC
LLGLLAAIPWRPRALLAATALLAGAWGGMRVADLDHRALRPGPFQAVVVVTSAPNGDRAIVRIPPAAEDVLLVARGERPMLGAVYRVRGRLEQPDPEVRGYYATQGVHLELHASRLALLGRRGGGWAVIDRLHDDALARLGASVDPSPQRALVAGVTLGDTSGMSLTDREAFKSSGLYHLVAVSGQNVALVSCLHLPVLR